MESEVTRRELPLSMTTLDTSAVRARVATDQTGEVDDGIAPPRLRPELLIVITVALGVILRTLQYGSNRSLWLDEVLMVPAIVRPSFVDLLSPGNWNHLAPGFLFVQKMVVELLGPTEYALRLVPFLAGIGVLLTFVRLASRAVSATAAPLAIALCTLSPFLIYYSSEVKPYATDALACTLLLIFAFHVLEHGLTTRRAALLWLATVVAAVFSLTATFVGAGVVLGMIIWAARTRDVRAVRLLLLVIAGWGVMFGAPYVLFLHGSATNEYAREFWRSGFMPFPPRSIEEMTWLPRALFQVFRDPLGVFSDQQSTSGVFGAMAGLVAFAAGCVWLARNRPARFWVLIGPILVTLIASALTLYPFGGSRVAAGRVLLFLVPVFILVMAEGAAQIWNRFRGAGKIVPLAIMMLMFVPPLTWAAVAVPVPRTEIKPLLVYLEQEAQPGDVLYVHYDVRHAFLHYAPHYSLAHLSYQPGVCARGEPERYLEGLSELRGAPRVWVLFGNGLGAGLFDERAISLEYLGHLGERLDDQITFGASLYLFDLRPEMAKSIPYSAELPVVTLGIADGCALWN